MKQSLNKITKNFILNEGQQPSINSWIQALSENLNSLRSKSLYENRKIEVMKQQLTELRRTARRMTSKIDVLEEELKIIKEERQSE
jgi:hypothetical protein|tara:strand:+ start:197 stop:454 length:258 start_codon:yes stop_codon:yes gene_type:complete